MTEIKFNAWDGDHMWKDVVFLFQTKEIILNHWAAGNKLHKVEEFLQYIGLKDKNGKEIYEGDILQRKQEWSDDEETVETFIISNELEASCGCCACIWGWKIPHDEVVEIIGNKHENPELWEQCK